LGHEGVALILLLRKSCTTLKYCWRTDKVSFYT